MEWFKEYGPSHYCLHIYIDMCPAPPRFVPWWMVWYTQMVSLVRQSLCGEFPSPIWFMGRCFLTRNLVHRYVGWPMLTSSDVLVSPDEETVYVTDGAADLSVGTNPRAIYAFDVNRSFDGNYHLSGKRLFAVPQVGIPDGIKVDTYGNLYAGCGDGLSKHISPSTCPLIYWLRCCSLSWSALGKEIPLQTIAFNFFFTSKCVQNCVKLTFGPRRYLERRRCAFGQGYCSWWCCQFCYWWCRTVVLVGWGSVIFGASQWGCEYG